MSCHIDLFNTILIDIIKLNLGRRVNLGTKEIHTDKIRHLAEREKSLRHR